MLLGQVSLAPRSGVFVCGTDDFDNGNHPHPRLAVQDLDEGKSQIAHGENARQAGLTFLVRDDVSARIHFHARWHELVVGRKPDEDEHAVGLDLPHVTGLHVLDLHSRHAGIVGQDFRGHGAEHRGDPWLGKDPLLQDAAAAKLLPTMDQIDLRADL